MTIHNDTIWSLSARLTSFSSTTEAHLISLSHSLVYSFIFAVPKHTGVMFHVSHPHVRGLSLEAFLHRIWKKLLYLLFEGLMTWYPDNSITLDYIMFALIVKGRILGSGKYLKPQGKIENIDLCWIRFKLFDVYWWCIYTRFAARHRNIYQPQATIQKILREDVLQLLATQTWKCAAFESFKNHFVLVILFQQRSIAG